MSFTAMRSILREPPRAPSFLKSIAGWLITLKTVILFVLNYFRVRYYATKFPIPDKTYPIVGHLHHLWKRKKPTEIVQLALECARQTRAGVFWASIYPLFFIWDPKDIEFIMNSPHCTEKAYIYYVLRPALGQGLVTGGGERWRRHTKIITPALNHKALESFVATYNEHTDTFIEVLRKKMTKGFFDVRDLIERLSGSIILEAAMGCNVITQVDPRLKIVEDIQEVQECLLHRVLRPWLYFDWTFRWTALARRQNKALAKAYSFRDEMIGSRRQQIAALEKQGGAAAITPEALGRHRRLAFVDRLLLAVRAGTRLTDEEIEEEVATFIGAGYDTISVLLDYAFYELGHNPHIQDKIVAELQTVYDPSLATIEVTSDDFIRLPYLDMVLKETLRLHPPIPVLARVAKSDVKLPSCDLVIPAGGEIIVAPLMTQVCEEFYPDPLKFDPERFLPEVAKTRPPHAFMPFSCGPRICIGKKFAMMEAKVVMAKVLWHFRILPDPTFTPTDSWGITLKPVNGIRVRLEERLR